MQKNQQPTRLDNNPFTNVKVIGGDNYFLDDFYHYLLKASWIKVIGILLICFLTIILIFAGLYFLDKNCLANTELKSFNDAFVFSLQTLTTIGYGNFYPANLYSETLVFFEAFMGLFIEAMSAGLMFAKFSVPKGKILFSQTAVIHNRDGVPTLCFRVANRRGNQIISTKANVVLSINYQTQEGDSGRTLIDLELTRQNTPIFGLTWSIYHPITPHSPLFGQSAETIKKLEAMIFVSLVGIDDTSGQTLQTQHSYLHNQIEWNKKFKDIIEIADDRIRSINLRNFHQTLNS